MRVTGAFGKQQGIEPWHFGILTMRAVMVGDIAELIVEVNSTRELQGSRTLRGS